ncbi:GNAT family N-acetyltransferase [Paraburkholderia tuberum]|uniref:Acetyltransferase (GNAT) family protein n=1 Tax=Paraburkholderia tuberum TaxID=157910 RepID=A0A1H1IVX9_9BURK|nr:GNAT family N-acetyltransferase [Paraburkholderia tuberum]SDR41730.1 Acetyltransferase (GNAT) family protein [Paraburkholderia tuberum]
MYAVESAPEHAPARDDEPLLLRFRAARADDAKACAPLIFSSGVREFGFFLGEPAEACIEFLAFAFASKLGRFSYRRHRVAVTEDDQPVAVLALHDGRHTWFDDPHVALMLVLFFGLRRTIRMLLRGLVLESELPAPKSSQTLIAHCATHERLRGTGVFSTLFADAMRAGEFMNSQTRAARGEHDRQQLVLDVLVSNKRAYALYRRLGFVELPRRAVVSPRLPRELESVRLEWLMKRTG